MEGSNHNVICDRMKNRGMSEPYSKEMILILQKNCRHWLDRNEHSGHIDHIVNMCYNLFDHLVKSIGRKDI